MLMFQINNPLDFSSLGVFIAFASECDWDRRHPTYGCLTKPDDYLANKWGCNLTTVWRNKKKLRELGFLSKSELGYFRLSHIEWFDPRIAKELAKVEFADEQDFIAKTKELIAASQEKFAYLQDSQGYSDPQSFKFPSKGNIGVSESESGEISEEERAWREEQARKSKEMSEVADEVFGNWKP